MSSGYSPRYAHLRRVAYNHHKLTPPLKLPSRVAWALAYQAGRRGVTVAQLIEELTTAWAEAWEEQLGESDRRRFLESIPHYRGPYGPRPT